MQGVFHRAWGCQLPSPLVRQRGVPPLAMAGSGAWWGVQVRPATLHMLRMDSLQPRAQVNLVAAMLTGHQLLR